MHLKFAIQEFYQEKRFENVTENTFKGYEYLFKIFEAYCEEYGVERIEDISSRVIKSFIVHCKNERGNNPVTLNDRLNQLKTFFNWLTKEKIIKENPAKEIKKLKEDVRIHTFTDDQVHQMLSYFRRQKRRENSFHSIRNYTIILTLLGTGIRVGELEDLKWDDIDFKAGSIRVFGKSRKDSTVPLSSVLSKELALYRVYCEKQFDRPSPYVFVDLKNESISSNAVKCVFKRMAKVLNFKDTRCSPHSCRHYYAKKYIQSGGDIVSLARILRHTNIKTTERYLHFFGNDLKESNEKYNPLNNLNI
ncbi:tyrosine-type recombinase/integrase [Fictibacillus fluitans]|uniref:Tyrosine-type recombinase/integrase n=1 Tax=Fictibacillus fluitans TaxID=3058422 RepID=A0ABT8HR03_9BACL|nr:tyrosine-type recombinase/integrase [Fictibacillus sp. NE201]MDN4523171.1 tyrosine-type recombinase/integrase [Fictibacillus sp. NE201]